MADPLPFPRTVRGVLGHQASEDLVTWQASGYDELRAGIRADVAELQQETYARMQAMERRITAQMRVLDEKLSDRIQGLDEKLSDRIQGLDEELSLRIHAVDLRVAESKADLMRWSLVFWVGAVAAIAMLAGVLR